MSTDIVVAADVGGTRMRAALVGPDGTVLLRRAVATPTDADVPAALIDLLEAVSKERALGAPSHAVVGLPGSVDYESGQLLWAPHLHADWPGVLSNDRLTARLGLPVAIANDADLAAVGEAVFGAGARGVDVAYLTISTGIGAGIVHHGRLEHGRRSLAELGHTVIDRRAWRDGLPSTLEELGSGSGLARLAREGGLGSLDAAGVGAAAGRGDTAAAALWRDAIGACAIGVANLVMAYSPDTVVVGGGLGTRPDFFDPLRARVLRDRTHLPDDLDVVPAALGDDAGLAGAARWVAASTTT
jgi:glucokinase